MKIEPTLALVASEDSEACFRLITRAELDAVYAEEHATPLTREQAQVLSVRAL